MTAEGNYPLCTYYMYYIGIEDEAIHEERLRSVPVVAIIIIIATTVLPGSSQEVRPSRNHLQSEY